MHRKTNYFLRSAWVAPLACVASVSGCAANHNQLTTIDLLTTLAKAQQGRSVAEQRAAMVENIRADIRAADPAADSPGLEKVLGVIGSLRREDFVQSSGRRAAYLDLPQSIGHGQTISDPYVVAVMTAALDLTPRANALDVGTGSGYQAAVLARIARHVSSIEIVRPLAMSAAARLRRMGFSNIDVHYGDGFLGWPYRAPFDGILVAASAAAVPAPLLDQLKPGGRLVMPIGATDLSTELLRITKRPDGTLERCSLGPAIFVPLTGARATPFARYGLRDRSIPLCFRTAIVGLL